MSMSQLGWPLSQSERWRSYLKKEPETEDGKTEVKKKENTKKLKKKKKTKRAKETAVLEKNGV